MTEKKEIAITATIAAMTKTFFLFLVRERSDSGKSKKKLLMQINHRHI